jgi:hypothetical protein
MIDSFFENDFKILIQKSRTEGPAARQESAAPCHAGTERVAGINVAGRKVWRGFPP